jgi:hypothetical protein
MSVMVELKVIKDGVSPMLIKKKYRWMLWLLAAIFYLVIFAIA